MTARPIPYREWAHEGVVTERGEGHRRKGVPARKGRRGGGTASLVRVLWLFSAPWLKKPQFRPDKSVYQPKNRITLCRLVGGRPRYRKGETTIWKPPHRPRGPQALIAGTRAAGTGTKARRLPGLHFLPQSHHIQPPDPARVPRGVRSSKFDCGLNSQDLTPPD